MTDFNFKYPEGLAKVLVEPLLEGKFQSAPSQFPHNPHPSSRSREIRAAG